MQVQAKTKFSGISAQKTRLVLNEMRGRPAQEALAVLAYMPQGAAKVVAILREKDTGAGVMTEDVYAGLGGKTRHWQSLVATLRANGTIRDNGGSKRGLRLFAPKDAAETAEHPTTGQTLTKKPRARVTARDKATGVERVVVTDGDVSPVESAE